MSTLYTLNHCIVVCAKLPSSEEVQNVPVHNQWRHSIKSLRVKPTIYLKPRWQLFLISSIELKTMSMFLLLATGKFNKRYHSLLNWWTVTCSLCVFIFAVFIQWFFSYDYFVLWRLGMIIYWFYIYEVMIM